MVKFEVSDIKEFKNVVDVTERYVPELRFDANSDGLSFVALNQGHVVFVSCTMDSNWFTVYECDEDTSFMVDCLELKNALSRIKGDGSLTCCLSDDDFELRYASLDGSTKVFKIGLISDLYDAPSPPNIDYPVSTRAEFQQLKEYCLDSLLYSDKVRFRFEDNSVMIGSSNTYTSYEGKVVLLDEISEACQVVISGEYLESFFKLSLSEEVSLDVGSDMPFHATVKSVDDCLTYTVLIAPRLEEDV